MTSAGDPFSGVPASDQAYFERMAAEFAASGRPASVPRQASTVVLMRTDGQVLLMRRAMGMVFGGRWAFPGGSVDPADRVADELETAANAALREVREETGYELDRADLIPWSRWLTPDFEPRRFDTYFFVGALRSAAEVVDDSGEAEAHLWIMPADAVTRYASGELSMLPPTAVTLRELAGHGTIDAVRAEAVHHDLAQPIIPGLRLG
ncbi:NUDIX hydrolase [Hamadaea tsunoensis]|uniref:NUDIX hydrolase n=1 Tax=Hamadaea tsunoensis TaxID=53368 RepID=UPI000406E49F|nr:NUDIX hydrolase [Hamadaea tsunoensis]